jgi:hypothetical protein
MTFDEAHIAIKKGDIISLRHASDGGMTPDLSNQFSWTLLMLAAIEGNTAIADLLVSRGADVNRSQQLWRHVLVACSCWEPFSVCEYFPQPRGFATPPQGKMSVMGILRQPSHSPTVGSCSLMRSAMKHPQSQPTVRPYGRLKVAGAGLALMAVGSVMLLRGVQVVTHWTGQPMFSRGLITGGGLCILLALVPAPWIARAAATDSQAGRHR